MKKGINITLGGRVRNARKKAGLTREQLSEKIDVSVRFLADVEGGITGVSISTLKLICIALGVSADYLIGNDSESNLPCQSLLKKASCVPTKHIESAERIIDEILKISSNS